MKRPMSNIELINHLLGFSKHGPLMQVVVLEGLRAYCQEIVDAQPGFLGAAGNMISEDAWRGCCQEYLDAYQNRDQLMVEEGAPVPEPVELDAEQDGLLKVLKALAGQGWLLHYVQDGGETTQPQTVEQAVEDASAVDEAWIHLIKDAGTPDQATGYVQLVWGNSPIELIADHTTNHGFGEAVDAALRSVWPNYPEE